ncbi:cardiolipin synthase [Diaphorobacter sp. HDW4A]|uniref:cardiolipin synthase n=1 Tax=Diaphorobacter sp. HDW4A TaxID=2714924 RepID=UPI00140E2E7C|nr:cardiolipin synthase [Diaphorobacter sp. HDW4A]QIL83311.1 cardiolipin synthase [Diaphorobacter sp. HDW4A]
MNHFLNLSWALLLFVAHLLVALRALTRPNRTPASRIAWLSVIMLVPLAGMVAYLLLGETSIGQARIQRMRRAEKSIAKPHEGLVAPEAVAPQALPLFDFCHYITGFGVTGGNRITVLRDADAPASEPMRNSLAAIDALVAHIEQASEQVHVAVYIWLDDDKGRQIAQAVAAAAQRGVQCRLMVDSLGSRDFVRSATWKMLACAGVKLHATLSDISHLRHMAFSRVDLRDHRKIMVIDNRIAFCGSQNFASPLFRIKPRFAPWIDMLLRCEGPIVRQMQYLFLSGWIPETGETGLDHLPAQAPENSLPGASTAQVFETGPTARFSAMSDMFVACIYAARKELVITTPYFVPDESMLRAICAAPRRGVKTTIIFPARNDSWLVGNACRSSYMDLLQSGVDVHEYPLGLLHTKSMTIDGELALVGSANMDRRSLELNYENNLLISDKDVTAQILERQMGYLSVSHRVDPEVVRAWPLHRRLTQNFIAMMAPVL